MNKIFYFNEINAFGEGVPTPTENKDIIIPENTSIIITKYIISPNSYNKLLIPSSSKLIFETTDTNLYIKGNIIIEGEIITTTNSNVVNQDISNNIIDYKYWHNLSSWHNFRIPSNGDDIIIKPNTNLVITNRTIFNNEKFGKLKIPKDSTLIIDIKNFKLRVSEFIQDSNSGSIVFNTGSTIEVSPPINEYINRYWHDENSWINNKIPEVDDNVVIPPYTRMIIHWKSSTFSNYFKSITVPKTSQLVIDLVNFTLRAEKFFVYGSIKLDEGSKLETLLIVYNYRVNCILNIYSTGVLYESLKYSKINQRNIIMNSILNYYKLNENQIDSLSYLFNNNTITINFTVKVVKNNEALEIIHLTKSTYNNECCIKDENNSTLIGYIITYFNQEFNSNLELSQIYNLNITSKSNIVTVDPQVIKPKITIWTVFPNNKFQKTYYFDDPDAWTNNEIPQDGEDIIIPQNIIMQITRYSISASRYNNLVVPHNSQLYFANENIDLYVKKINNRGIIRSSKNSSIIASNTKASSDQYVNWNDPNAWNGNNPPNAGEHIIIPENTNIVVTYQSGISEVGYKKLVLPSTSSLKFDIKYFHFYVQSMSVNGTLIIGDSNTISLKPYVSLTRTYLPVYLDSTGKMTTDCKKFFSNIKADYNFTLSALYTKAINISKFIKYRRINGKTSFIYEPKQIPIIEDALKNDLITQPLFHVEQKFISNYNTVSDTLSNLYIQYISDILVGNPQTSSMINNTSQIQTIINSSKIESQITNVLKNGLNEVQYSMNNIILNSMFDQLKNEKPQRILNRKDFEIYYFPIYNGDDLSIFVKMQANIPLEHYDYLAFKTIYTNNFRLEFVDIENIVKIKPTTWRIFINLS